MRFLRAFAGREEPTIDTLLPDGHSRVEVDFWTDELPEPLSAALSERLAPRAFHDMTSGFLGSGSYSSVFALSEDLVLKKFMVPDKDLMTDVIKDFLIASYLRSENIAAPRPHCILLYPKNTETSDGKGVCPALIMQRLHEKHYYEFSFLERHRVRRWHTREKKKIRNLGLIVRDSYEGHNVLYDRVSRQPYFIDFSRWDFADPALTLEYLKERFPLVAYDLAARPCHKIDTSEHPFFTPKIIRYDAPSRGVSVMMC